MLGRKRAAQDSASGPGLGGRLAAALRRTREALAGGLAGLLGRARRIDEALLEELEALLLGADVGVAATERICAELRRHPGAGGEDAIALVREQMLAILGPVARPLEIPAGRERPFVVLVVGVNGSGKTTTIGKLAHRLGAAGRRVMLAAGDTYRSAAIEQLQRWGERCAAPVIAQHPGADSASVCYDALEAATARRSEVLIADTAGRLHTQEGLMAELAKVRRVLGKIDPEAPHETLLVLDGGTGQNALVQARTFQRAVGVSGLALTKLDGTAKGGILLAIAAELAIPVRFIGVGEGLDDLREFDAREFVDALLAR